MSCNGYDKAIGYSPLEDVDRDKLRRQIRMIKRLVFRQFLDKPANSILVAGAGQGDEAELIFEEFALNTVGVDINLARFKSRPGLSLSKQNLENLAFVENAFSFIYSYHVLEHVADHLVVLRELCRVLIPGGVMFIGFPNKNRLFSYVGTTQKASALEKIKWNLNDYRYRLQGKFENKYGAHAGFTESEFLSAASGIFQTVLPVRNEYMLAKYARLGLMIRAFIFMGLGEILFPSNYYICVK